MVKIITHNFDTGETLYDIVFGFDYELESCPADYFDQRLCDLSKKDLLEIKKELDKLKLI